MRRKISLYIADQLVDLTDQSFILFNYTMEDLSNPTIVRNSFSQQITLKGTPNNNKIFGGMFRLDRQTQYGDSYTGAFFDSSRKTPFVIYNERNEIVESGYVKLDEVIKNRGLVEYKVTLYGGLGSFFYGLKFNEDGTQRTLDGLRFKFADGSLSTSLVKDGGFDHNQVQEAWSYLQNPNMIWRYSWQGWNIINFAPAYNGVADGFDAKKCVMSELRYNNVSTNPVIDGEVCTFKTGTSSILATFANAHNMWEVKDLRWYLMRPVINVYSLLIALIDPYNNGGYDVELNVGELLESPILTDSWITLPMIKPEDKGRDDVFHTILSGSQSPAEYLISIAKMLGLVFLYDKGIKKVTICRRADLYKLHQNDIIDITSRLDVSSVSIKPVLADSHFYQMGGGAIGEWAEQYKKNNGFEYAIQRINTGNDFNLDTKQITEGIIYKDGVDVQERSLMFQSDGYQILYDDESNEIERRYFMLPLYEDVEMQYFTTRTQEERKTNLVAREFWDRYFFNDSYPYVDWLPKLQLHGQDNKSIDGANMLLIYNGTKECPVWKRGRQLEYYLTDDTNDMLVLNESTPCWNLTTDNSIPITMLPSFRRHKTHSDGIWEYPDFTWEWGQPRERGVNDFKEGLSPTIYNRYWKKYLTDRYDDDTFILKCKVDLRGFNVGQELLGRFFYYDNAIFVLNAIKNYSLTTWSLTECEFIKVQNINNYTE